MRVVDPNEPNLFQRFNEAAAKHSIRAATLGGTGLVVLDVLSGQAGALLLGGCTLLGSAVIATAIKGRST